MGDGITAPVREQMAFNNVMSERVPLDRLTSISIGRAYRSESSGSAVHF
jgi:hypothetical protein